MRRSRRCMIPVVAAHRSCQWPAVWKAKILKSPLSNDFVYEIY
jgi:hypothetical protein